MNVLSLRKFVAPEIVFGGGARKLAGKYAKNLGATRVLIVTDPGVMAAGWLSDVAASLEDEAIDYKIYSNVSPNPRAREVMTGAAEYREFQCDAIVAVGGGSPMDCAKGIGIVCSNSGDILDFEGIDKIKVPSPPLIFIPTTAGTSSDVSQFSIILNENELVKIAIISKAIVPDIALIDYETTMSMTPYLTACTGIDAIVHAIEAFVSTASSPLTDLHALEAIRIITRYLPGAVNEPQNHDYRSRVMFASLQAGLAFSNAILGAVHSMAHSLGGFLDLAHGECNAILLNHVVDFNYSCASKRYDEIAGTMGMKNIGSLPENQRKTALIEKIIELKNAVGITKKLSGAGVKACDIPTLAKKAHKDPCLLTNPRKATPRDIEVIYEGAL